MLHFLNIYGYCIDFQVTKAEEPSPAKSTKSTKSTKSNDDDDWSDFVSNTEPAKTLQLSVLNLNQIQPIRPPVPLITPQGLMQTKIPTSPYIPPLLQTGVPQQRLQVQQSSDGYQPSIISNQFSKEFELFTNPSASSQQNTYSANFMPNPPVQSQDNKDDDEDWTDFISVRPSTNQNPVVPASNQSSSFAPNIITNPGHGYYGYGMNGDVNGRKVAAPAVRNAVSSISALPDLDFVFSKGRTYGNKK